MRALGAIHRASRSSSYDGETQAVARRRAGERIDAAVLADVLKRHGVSPVTGNAVSADLSVSVHQDDDFGPVIVVGDTSQSPRRDACRVVRALPVAESALAVALSESTLEALGDPEVRAALLPVLVSVCEVYEREAGIAEITVKLQFDDGAMRVVEAHALATEGMQ
jgi:hypothetical protein